MINVKRKLAFTVKAAEWVSVTDGNWAVDDAMKTLHFRELRYYMTKQRDSEFKMLSEAVQAWYRFYEVSPDARASQFLSNAALKLHNEGYKAAGDIASVLIETYVGIWSTKVNAPTSSSVH